MPDIYKATIFVEDFDDCLSQEYIWVQNWLKRWGENIVVAEYSSGGWEHIWDVSGSKEALKELPEELLCASDWAGHS